MSQIREIDNFGLRGEPARLIPTVADRLQEQRVVSALLATVMAVPEFGQHLLKIVGAPATSRSSIECFTEVQAPTKSSDKSDKKDRPDGLIVVRRGKTVWSALVEAKVGRNELDQDQVERYLTLARNHGIDAVVTISNQFVPDPRATPLKIDGRKLMSVDLYHWSWTSILSEGILFADHKGISDPDQAFILKELIRYLQHDSSGVQPFTQMSAAWKGICVAASEGRAPSKSSEESFDAAGSWVQLSRYLALQLTLAVGQSVQLHMSRQQKNDPRMLVTEAIECIVNDSQLYAGFDVPNAAGTLWLEANLKAKTLSAWMTINAPRDRVRPSAAITFLLRQLDQCPADNMIVDTFWPNRSVPTSCRLTDIREDRSCVLDDRPGVMPRSFRVRRLHDLGAKIGGVQKFVKLSRDMVTSYYDHAGQHLWNWVPPAPKVVTDNPDDKLKGVTAEEGGDH